jgi:hypothetical protein
MWLAGGARPARSSPVEAWRAGVAQTGDGAAESAGDTGPMLTLLSLPRRVAVLVPPFLAAGVLVACGGQTAGTAADGGGGAELPPGLLDEAGGPFLEGGPFHPEAGYPVDAAPVPVTDGGGSLPSNPGGPTPTGTGSAVFAISKLYYGDTDRYGVLSASAWMGYGLDIDGKITTKTSTDVCTLAAGAAKSTQADGQYGIDNSFGENILPIFIMINGSNFSTAANARIAAGGSTMLIRIDALGPGADYAPLTAGVFHAGPTSSTPAWNGSDVRTVDVQSLIGGSLQTPILTFPAGYMNQRVWAGAPPSGNASFDIDVWGVPGAPPTPMTHVQMAMRIDPSNASGTQGTLSGILPTQPLIAYLQKIAGSLSMSLCSGSAFQSIAQQIAQAQDIMGDGTNQPGTACDAISIGLGFDAAAVQLGSVVTLPAAPNPCADGG